MINFTKNGIKLGDRIQCENDKDELRFGTVSELLDEATLVYQDEDDNLQHEVRSEWCEVIYKCDECNDTGEVTYDELDEDSMRMMNGTGVTACPMCKQPSLFND